MSEWDEGSHPRDEQGKFSAGGGLGRFVEKYSKRFAGPLLSRAVKTGGFSYKPGAAAKDRTPSTGIMVSRDPKDGLGHVVEIAKMNAAIVNRDPKPTEAQARAELAKQIRQQVVAWLKKSLPAVKESADHYLGGWHEKSSSGASIALHLDVSQRFASKDKDAALRAGRDRNQLAVYHIEKGEEIATGGTGR